MSKKKQRQERILVVSKRKIFRDNQYVGSMRVLLHPLGAFSPKNVVCFQFKFYALPDGRVMEAIKDNLEEIMAFKTMHITQGTLALRISP